MKQKEERFAVIENLIRTYTIRSQSELLDRLKSEGFEVTQATLSRDIKQLKIVKTPDDEGNYSYQLPGKDTYTNNEIINNKDGFSIRGFISIEFSGHFAVIKTRPGYAMGIASDIDNHATKEILGTIAGDDTILIIPREGVNREEIIKIFKQLDVNGQQN